jgi:hypothetical protein
MRVQLSLYETALTVLLCLWWMNILLQRFGRGSQRKVQLRCLSGHLVTRYLRAWLDFARRGSVSGYIYMQVALASHACRP